MLGYSEDQTQPSFFPAIGFFCTDVDETEDGHFAYSHRMRPGVNRDSHGLKVAQLGGMPQLAMQIATDALRSIKNNEGNRVGENDVLRKLGKQLADRYDHGRSDPQHSPSG